MNKHLTLTRALVLGHFLPVDAIVPQPGNPQRLNRYATTLNNPLRYTDPSGHAYCPPEANGRCIAEHEPPPDPLPIRFEGDWPVAHRMAVLRGAQAVADAVFQVFLAERSRMGSSSALTAAIAPRNMPLNAQSAFRMVFGTVTFRRVATNHGTAWAYVTMPNITVYANVFEPRNIYPRDGHLNTGHELGHAFAQRAGGRPYSDLMAAQIGVNGEIIAGGGWLEKPGYQRTDAGYYLSRNTSNPRWPWQQNHCTKPGDGVLPQNEDFADMFLNWSHNHFTGDSYGAARYQWMNANMPNWMALAVAGK